jgi:hypothetical protein
LFPVKPSTMTGVFPSIKMLIVCFLRISVRGIPSH